MRFSHLTSSTVVTLCFWACCASAAPFPRLEVSGWSAECSGTVWHDRGGIRVLDRWRLAHAQRRETPDQRGGSQWRVSARGFSPRSEFGRSASKRTPRRVKKALISSVWPFACAPEARGTQKEPALQTHTVRAACPWVRRFLLGCNQLVATRDQHCAVRPPPTNQLSDPQSARCDRPTNQLQDEP